MLNDFLVRSKKMGVAILIFKLNNLKPKISCIFNRNCCRYSGSCNFFFRKNPTVVIFIVGLPLCFNK
jgi:hypothetical protein